MNRLGDKHEDKSKDDREDGHPRSIPKRPIAENPNDGTAQVSANQRPGLGSWCTGKAEKEDSRPTQRGEQKGRERRSHDAKSQADPHRRPHGAPAQAADDCGDVHGFSRPSTATPAASKPKSGGIVTASDSPDTEPNENDARPEGKTGKHPKKDRIGVWIVVEAQARVEHDASERTRPKNQEHEANLN